jgi:hypothetical protein
MKGTPKLTSIQNVVDRPWRRVTVTALPVEASPGLAVTSTNKGEGQPSWSPPCRTSGCYLTSPEDKSRVWTRSQAEKVVSHHGCVTSREIHVGKTRCGVCQWRLFASRFCSIKFSAKKNAHCCFFNSVEGGACWALSRVSALSSHGGALGGNSRQEDNDRIPRCSSATGILGD